MVLVKYRLLTVQTCSMINSDPITNPMSSYNDVTDKYKLIPRVVIVVFSLAYLYAIYSGKNSDTIYVTGIFLSVMTIAYVIGVDSLKDIIDAVIKHKHLINSISEVVETNTVETTTSTKMKH